MPLVWLLHAENSTVFGHVIFGVLIARFPAYLPADRRQSNRPRRNRRNGPTRRNDPADPGLS